MYLFDFYVASGVTALSDLKLFILHPIHHPWMFVVLQLSFQVWTVLLPVLLLWFPSALSSSHRTFTFLILLWLGAKFSSFTHMWFSCSKNPRSFQTFVLLLLPHHFRVFSQDLASISFSPLLPSSLVSCLMTLLLTASSPVRDRSVSFQLPGKQDKHSLLQLSGISPENVPQPLQPFKWETGFQKLICLFS